MILGRDGNAARAAGRKTAGRSGHEQYVGAAGETVTALDVAVNVPALVLTPKSIVSALSYDRPLNAATPEDKVTVVVP